MTHHVSNGKLTIKNNDVSTILNPIPGTNLMRLTISQRNPDGTFSATQETFRVNMSEGRFGDGFETNEPFERPEPTHRLINASEMVSVFSGSEEECQEMLGNVNDPDEHFIEAIQ